MEKGGGREINANLIEITSDLISRDLYPWGLSRRVYIDKPGTKVKRPITIPPFMDRVVQTAVKMILYLEAIYEPYFNNLNISFGFRPNRGSHDAIYNITRPYSRTMNIAVEGDIKGAYNKVSRNKLIKILSLRIQDKKFLNFIAKRLEYLYYDTEERQVVEDKEGIPSIPVPYPRPLSPSPLGDRGRG